MEPSFFCDPLTKAPLSKSGDALVNPETGHRYGTRDGIPIFLEEVTGLNRKYQSMYDRLSYGYDFAERAYKWIVRKPDLRSDYIKELEIEPGARVLEVSVGTGANIPYLRQDAEFYGLDLSWGMLRQCARTLKKLRRQGVLCQGEAEHLPFPSAAFDCVFHVGGINFFNDKASAITEMIRVARPGTKIVIVDETEQVITGDYRMNPFTRKYFEGAPESAAVCPIGLVPPEMREIEAHGVGGGKLYCLTFRTPL
jgi:ubiquinone/menaquinone biosynthesis C-methylase UbiE